eukprot:SAG31_NODE_1569_length_7855_cov_13.073234_7_plen_370_part_00
MCADTPESPFLVEYDGYVRAVVVADNYQNSVDLTVQIHIDQVAPVRIYPAGDAIVGNNLYNRRSRWITVTDQIFLWTPTPNAQVKFYETETVVSNHAIWENAYPNTAVDWTCFAGCDDSNTANFTRDYSIDLFARAYKTTPRPYAAVNDFVESDIRSEFFEVVVDQPVSWPAYETNQEWRVNAKVAATAHSDDDAVAATLTGVPLSTESDANPDDLTPESNRVSELSAGQSYRCDRVFGTIDPEYDSDETADNCLDRFYLGRVEIFLATETPTTDPMGGDDEAACLPGIKCPSDQRLKIITYKIGHEEFCNDFAPSDCVSITKCELNDENQCTSKCANDPQHSTCNVSGTIVSALPTTSPVHKRITYHS